MNDNHDDSDDSNENKAAKLQKVVAYYSSQISNFVEAKVKQDGFEEGIEMDILLRALFIQVGKKQESAKFQGHDLEYLITRSFNEYAAAFKLNIYAKDYVDPEKPIFH